MEELKVLENDLVPVYETSTGKKVVYGTELHKALGVKSNYRDWIRNRIKECDAIENEDYEAFAKNLAKPKGGRPSVNHIMKIMHFPRQIWRAKNVEVLTSIKQEFPNLYRWRDELPVSGH